MSPYAGSALHDMLMENNGTPVAYTRALLEVKPLLDQISKTTRVVWYHTYPIADLTFKGWKPSELSQPKVHQYNKIVRNVLK